MIAVRKGSERGVTRLDWLDSRHTFSFGDYYDAKEMGFASLRVINDDHIAQGGGFPTHSHRDMEIVTYLLAGALEHRDSIGNGSVINRGDVQRMSAGTGVTHSEFNASKSEAAHLLQIWIVPDRRGYPPGYEQHSYSDEDKRGRLRLVASGDGRDGSVTIHQDARMYAGILEAGKPVNFAIAAGRRAYLHVASGVVEVKGLRLEGGDGARINDEREIEITAAEPSEVLLFDLA